MGRWDALLTPAVKDFLAGYVSGAAGCVAGQPLDTARVRLQQPRHAYRGLAHCWSQMVAREGALSLYKGMASPLYSMPFQNALTFQAYGMVTRALGEHDRKGAPVPHWKTFTAGLVAGGAQALVIAPIDHIKVKLQMQQGKVGETKIKGPLEMMRIIYRAEGLRGVMRGTPVTMLRDAPSYGLYFVLYEGTREWLHDMMGMKSEDGSSSGTAVLLAGGIAGALAWLSVYPVDVIKTRYQAQGAGGGAPLHGSATACFLDEMRREGGRGLLQGLGSTILRAFVVNAVIFYGYDVSMAAMGGD